MIRKLLSLVLFLAVVGTASAQAPKSLAVKNHNPFAHQMEAISKGKALKAKARAGKKAIEAGEGQMWYGYANPDALNPLGVQAEADYNIAIWIPYEKIAGKGATIDAIRFYLATADHVENVKVWISTKLPEVDKYNSSADLEIKDVETVVEGANDVAFSKSYEIPEGGLYVGYSFDITGGVDDYPEENYTTNEEYYDWYYNLYQPWLESHPSAQPFTYEFVYGNTIPGTMFFASSYYDELYRYYATIPGYENYLNYVGWDDYSSGYLVGVEALIGGDKFLANAASAADFGEKYVAVNDKVTFPVTITNSGTEGLKSFTYEVAFNGTKVDEQTITLEGELTNILASTTQNITFGTGDQTGKQQVTITITKVNGVANEVEAVASGAIIVLAESAQKKPLVEEFTGTWCGWCTRGWVGLEKISEDFEGKVVPVAVHNGDPMEIEDYFAFVYANVAGFPSMLIDRGDIVDPYYGSDDETPYGVKNDVEKALAAAAPVSISVKAAWTDDSKTKIKIDTDSKFLYDDADPSVAIGYLLVADGLKGAGRSWAQANYYSSYADEYGDDPDLGPLTEMPNYILGMEFNHVVVASWGAATGIDKLDALKAGETVTKSFEADLEGVLIGEDRNSEDPDDHVTVLDLIDGKKLQVVAFIVNNASGEILNADEVLLEAGTATGITTVSTKENGTAVERYNAAGQRITGAQKGLNIIKLSSGKTIKVLVK